MGHQSTTVQTDLQTKCIKKMTQTFTESSIFTTYHSKGQESPVRVQPFYVIRNNEVL